MHTHTLAHTRINIYIYYMCVCLIVCVIYIYINIYIYILISTYIYMCVCVFECVCVCMYTIYIYIYLQNIPQKIHDARPPRPAGGRARTSTAAGNFDTSSPCAIGRSPRCCPLAPGGRTGWVDVGGLERWTLSVSIPEIDIQC